MISLTNPKGMKISRVFSRDNVSPYDEMEWETRSAEIKDENGKTIFLQDDCHVPKSWSQLATNIVASKYFYGEMGTPNREFSVRLLIDRVASTISKWGKEDGYFASSEDADRFQDELKWLCVNQCGSFNSPVWFNVGIYHVHHVQGSGGNWRWSEVVNGAIPCDDSYKYPQSSACFIQSVEDNMGSIMDLAKSEAMLFKYGSGTGTDLSPLRSTREKLAGGGKPSGPLSFLRVYDKIAGVIKSGGKCLAPQQPVYTAMGPIPIQELSESGKDFTVLSYSNSAGRPVARTARAWKSGIKEIWALETDKGVFHLSYDHPVMLKTGEFLAVSDLKPGMSLQQTRIKNHPDGYVFVCHEGWEQKLLHRMIAEDILEWDIDGRVVHHSNEDKTDSSPGNLELVENQSEHARMHGKAMASTGNHVFQKNSFKKVGKENGMHSDSDFWRDPSRVDAYSRKQGDILIARGDAAKMQTKAVRQKMKNTAYAMINAGYDISTFENYMVSRKAVGRPVVDRRKQEKSFSRIFGSYEDFYKELRSDNHEVISVLRLGTMDVYDVEVDHDSPDDGSRWDEHNFGIVPVHTGGNNNAILFVHNTRRAAKLNTLLCNHPDIIEFIESKSKEEDKAHALIREGYEADFNGEAYSTVSFQNANLSVRATDDFLASVELNAEWETIAVTTGEVIDGMHARDILYKMAECAWKCGDPGIQYHDTIQKWHTCPNTAPINSSNPCCFIYETMVDTSEGRIPIGVLAEMDSRGEKLPAVMSFDKNAGIPVMKTIEKVWKSGESTDFIEIRTYKGLAFQCTPDHIWLLRDGREIKASDLKLSDELQETQSLKMPFDYVTEISRIKYDSPENVYDMSVPGTNNFAIGSEDSPHSVIVHNSEYMFIDDSACNLASINLMKFRNDDGKFDSDRFRAACRIFITAQEILVDHSSYPTEKVAHNSHWFRPLGLGYANLGSLIMAHGYAYDSSEGRGLAAAITAIMSGEAYLASAEHARNLGSFEGFEINRDPMLRVIEMHRMSIGLISGDAPANLIECARDIWDKCIKLGREHGYRNSQISVLAPTGTIAFMMDCDTTGVEPDIALVKYKNLAGRGLLKIVNQTVPESLRGLGYKESQIIEIIDYINKNDTIEGSPYIIDDDLPVFDCAFEPPQGGRSIGIRGHLRMMAAVQPFISGAISKTINMPSSSTINDILKVYMEGWHLNLKAVAIYRDGSKKSQPVSTKKSSDENKNNDDTSKPVPLEIPEPSGVVPHRERLPHTRHSLTHKFNIGGHEGYINVGFYPDGRPGELFITMAKEGSTIGGLMDILGTSISIGLQYGVPLDVLVGKFTNSRFEPSGFTKNPDIPMASSIVDYIFRWLGTEFIPGYREANSPNRDIEPSVSTPTAVVQPIESGQARQFAGFQIDSPLCDNCGSLTVRCGTCYRCYNCGNSMGCS